MLKKTLLAATAAVLVTGPAFRAGNGHCRHRGRGGFVYDPRGRSRGRRLVETLKGEGPFTVFAPTDEAFAALTRGGAPLTACCCRRTRISSCRS